jgi:hypothetical protein
MDYITSYGSPSLPKGHPLAGLRFQEYWERKAFDAAGADYSAPAQRVVDYIASSQHKSRDRDTDIYKDRTYDSNCAGNSDSTDNGSKPLPDHIFMGKLKQANLHR